MVQWGDVAAWLAAAIAVAAAVVSIVQARKANSSAERSANAAERSAAADERMASLTEEQASAYFPPWHVNWVKGDTFELRNNSDWDEYGVVLSANPDGQLITRFDSEPVDIDAHSSIEFLAARTGSTTDSTITVRWHRERNRSDDALKWRFQLPRK